MRSRRASRASAFAPALSCRSSVRRLMRERNASSRRNRETERDAGPGGLYIGGLYNDLGAYTCRNRARAQMPLAAACSRRFSAPMAAAAESPVTLPLASRDESGSLSQWALIGRRFARHRLAVAAVFLLAILYVLAGGAEFFAPYSRQWRDLSRSYCPPQLPRWSGRDGSSASRVIRSLVASPSSPTCR